MTLQFALLFFISAFASDKTVVLDTVAVDYVGSSGQIKLYPIVASDDPKAKDSRYIKISLDKLIEVAPSNGSNGWEETKNKAGSISSTNYDWIAQNTSQGYTNVTAVTNFTVDGTIVNFRFSTIVASANTDVTKGNGNVTNYAKDTVLFGFYIAHWPFLNESNKLALGIKINAGGSGPKEAKTTAEKADDKKITFADYGSISFDTKANILDDNWAVVNDVAVIIDVKGDNTTTEKQFDGTIYLPSHAVNRSILYDPVMSSASGMEPIWLLGLLPLLASFF